MKKILPLLSFCFLFVVSNIYSQNVGIGTTTPSEKLDVTGNINVTGTIKANGVDGTPNQVLMKSSGGLLTWGEMCEYRNYTTYLFTTAGAIQNFIVPAGVTKIKVQIWGGGGLSTGIGGTINMSGGGGGGGYIEGALTVSPASSINIRVGNGAGPGFATSTGSQVDFASIILSGQGGGNASYDATFTRVTPGVGGNYVGFGTTSFFGMKGEGGGASNLRYDQISATEFGRAFTEADGGNAGNTLNTAGRGGFFFFNVTASTILSSVLGSHANVPGGGASSGVVGPAGGHGLVIIHY